MKKLPAIVLGPDARLSAPCLPCGADDVDEIANTLLAFAVKNERTCAGIAANQLGFDRRVCVIKHGARFRVLVDPVIVKSAGYTMSDEGCLSWPGRRFKVERATMVKVRTRNGTIKLRNFAAIVAQHEVAHLDGKGCGEPDE